MNAPETALFAVADYPAVPIMSTDAKPIISPAVLVTEGRLKVDDHVYSLTGVTEVKPEIVLTRISVAAKVRQVVCWVLVILVVAGMIWAWSPTFKPLRLADVFQGWLFIGVPWVFAFRMGSFDKIDRYHRASVILMRGTQKQRVVIGAFRPVPNGDMERRMLSLGYHPEDIARWKEGYEPGLARAKAIVEAVGNAIGQTVGR